MLSHALGGTVSRTSAPEIGWYEPALEPGAPPVAAGPWMEWHDDVFTVPEGFGVLATTPTGPQLIASRRAVGTQFHPEATETMVRDWIEHGGAEQYRSRGGDPDELLAETRTNTARSRPAAEALVDWFLAHAGSQRAPSTPEAGVPPPPPVEQPQPATVPPPTTVADVAA